VYTGIYLNCTFNLGFDFGGLLDEAPMEEKWSSYVYDG
jgi:hypothetical protein